MRKILDGTNLRNSLLHQGTPNIEVKNIKDANNKIDHFKLAIETKKPLDIYGDMSGIDNGSVKSYCVNVRRLCLILSRTAKGYYEANQDKFDFFNFTIIDWDSEVDKMHKIMI